MITLCPIRREEGGIGGTFELGHCITACAAFDPLIPAECYPNLHSGDPVEGYCKYYFAEVVGVFHDHP